MEREASFAIANLQSEIQTLRNEREELHRKQIMFDEEVNKLKTVVQQKEQESKSRESLLIELENLTKTLPKGTSIADVSNILAKGGKLSDIVGNGNQSSSGDNKGVII